MINRCIWRIITYVASVEKKSLAYVLERELREMKDLLQDYHSKGLVIIVKSVKVFIHSIGFIRVLVPLTKSYQANE